MLESLPGLPARYRLVRLLGQGGQAKTFLADDETDSRAVAIKVFELRDAESWKGYDLFERECRVLRSLRHPHVIQYIEHGGDEARGLYWLVMEYAAGRTLEEGMGEGDRFTDAELTDLLRQLLGTLDYLHSLNPPVFHRDIKPGNVVLTEDQGAKLVDFGGVRDVFSDRAKSTVVGTFGYMAPEQLRGEATPASDLYGLGATMAAIATGTDAAELPHAGLELDLARCIKPGRVREVLQGMLRADPRERTASAAEALAQLDESRSLPARREPPPLAVTEDRLAEVEALAASGNQIAAIRRYRELTGAPLREAREAVRAISPLPAKTQQSLAPVQPADQRRSLAVAFGVGGALITAGIASGVGGLIPLGVMLFPLLYFFAKNVFRGYRSSD